MMADCTIFDKILSFQSRVLTTVEEISAVDLSCKSIIVRYLEDTNCIDQNAVLKIQAVIDYMYEQINIGNWKEVRPFLRKTVTISCYLRLLAHLKLNEDLTDEVIKKSFEIMDLGILFGCPLMKEPQLLQECASCLNSLSFVETIAIKPTTKEVNNTIDIEKNSFSSVDVSDCPSMETFLNNYILKNKPVVLNNCINHWPALQKWQDQNYFLNLAGLRTVSVELGKKYTDSDWTQKLMTMEEFIKNYIYKTDGPIGYLAQYQLFNQIPELKNDIIEPEYCCFSDTNESVEIMAWFGPQGTVSPVHHDPKRNLLAQVVGEKQIYLFSPQDSEFLYPHSHELLNNTARVDPRQPDLEKFPLYQNATPYYCVLKPGQMLYIPPKWWHFVESLSLSFSVSFWWE